MSNTITLEDTIILTSLVGSRSYRTHTDNSDWDYMSVVIPEKSYYLGSKGWGSSGTIEESYDAGYLSDLSPLHVEHKYFEIKKFMGMCTVMNPNAIPLLWNDPADYTLITPVGKLLLDNRTIFNSKLMYNTFTGFALSQLAKMGGIFNDLETTNLKLKEGHLKFQAWAKTEIDNQRKFRDYPEKWKDSDLYEEYDEGYLNALTSLKNFSKEEFKKTKDAPRTGKMGAARKSLREKYGFDTKYAMHLMRLLTMCVEFLKRPEEGIKVNRYAIDNEFLIAIRNGKYSQEFIKTAADGLLDEATNLLKTTNLPDKPDKEKIENLTIEILEKVLFSR